MGAKNKRKQQRQTDPGCPHWVCTFLIWGALSSPNLDIRGTDPSRWAVSDFAAGSPLPLHMPTCNVHGHVRIFFVRFPFGDISEWGRAGPAMYWQMPDCTIPTFLVSTVFPKFWDPRLTRRIKTPFIHGWRSLSRTPPLEDSFSVGKRFALSPDCLPCATDFLHIVYINAKCHPFLRFVK